jgi:hypothetical protein
MRRMIALVTMFVAAALAIVGAQSAGNVAERLGHADYVLYNGKVVSVDDAGFNESPGTIHQAIAVRGNRILATGTDASVKALAGPKTTMIDLKGRTVLPSLIMTHEHPTDWIWLDPEPLKYVVPENNDYLIVRFLKGTAEEQIASWEQTLKDAVAMAKPGQWILLSSYWGPNMEHMPGLWYA